jgi:hypothetical protein
MCSSKRRLIQVEEVELPHLRFRLICARQWVGGFAAVIRIWRIERMQKRLKLPTLLHRVQFVYPTATIVQPAPTLKATTLNHSTGPREVADLEGS